ncbi:MAG TPA: butyrate kinase [Clostridiales bacterium]|nr:butyrate kinase [Clostridiales bacterium]
MAAWLFVLNPGSTSTKTALFHDRTCLQAETVRHSPEELARAGSVFAQLPVRLAAIRKALDQALSANRLRPEDITAYVGRGGLLHPLPSGIYRVSPDMLADLEMARYGDHASNLGAVIASMLARDLKKEAYIVDPPCVDEMVELARYTGLPQIRRISAFHALNHKAVGRLAAETLGRTYDSCNLVIAHLGGGISVGAHRQGHVVDVNNALEEGPFSPERAGSLPTRQLLDLCYKKNLSLAETRQMLVGQGGLYAYTGTIDCRLIEEQAAARPDYLELLQAMAYQTAKTIGAMAVSLAGKIDAIALTGGLAHSAWLTGLIQEQVAFLGPVLVFPGEYEMTALAERALKVLRGEEEAQDYVREPWPEDAKRSGEDHAAAV